MKKAIVAMAAFLAFMLPVPVSAGNIELDIRQITIDDGLPANSIRCLYQDNMGFIWIGTINSGLCKYDGSRFTLIYPDYGVGPGLSDPRISTITGDKYDHLWITTMSDQINCYDLRTESFVDYSGNGHYEGHYGHVTFVGDDIWVWGKSQGCMRIIYDGESFSSERFSTQTDNLPSDNVSFLLQDGDCVWLGTSEGLCRYQNGKMDVVVSKGHFPVGEKLSDASVFISETGDIWRQSADGISHVGRIKDISASGEQISGYFSIDGESLYIFTTAGAYLYEDNATVVTSAEYPYDLKSAEVLSDGRGNFLIHDKFGNVVFADAVAMTEKAITLNAGGKGDLWTSRYGFVRTQDDVVWISSHDNGLFAYDIENDDIHHFAMTSDQNGPSSNVLMSVIEDKSGNLWVGSEFSGLFKAEVISKGAEYIHFGADGSNEYADMVRNIAIRKDGNIWVCTRDGSVHIYNASLGKYMGKHTFDANVYAVCEDDESGLWIGTRGKGLLVNGKRYYNVKKNHQSLSNDNIFDLLRDSGGNIWIGTFGGGLNLAVPDGKGGFTFRNFFNDSYSRRHVRVLCEDANGYIWAGTSAGVIVFHPERIKSDPTAYYEYNTGNQCLRSNECRSIFCDSHGRIWLSETGVGFSICVPEEYDSLTFKHYGPEDGLVSALVQGFVEDDSGCMWITTEYGLSCFDFKTQEFCNYRFSNNMQSNVCLDNCTAKISDGRILIGTCCGMVVIDPSEVPVNHKQQIDKPVFTSLIVQGTEVGPSGESSPIASSISYCPDVVLEHDQSTFTIEFSTLDYSDDVMYTYMLEGYDDNWSIPDKKGLAVYKQIPPGRYVFKVKACDAMGRWHKETSCLNVRVMPPFYLTPVAYVIYFILFGLLLYVVSVVLSRFAKLKNEAKLEKELTEYKLMFFTNISHEFRTPLTLILHSLEKLRRSELSTTNKTTLRTMEVGTTRLMRLINQLLEFRKIQNDKHCLRLESTDVVRFCQDVFEIFQESALNKNITFVFNSNEASYVMYLDRGDMDKVIYNLISNSIKYTPEGGKIELSVDVDHNAQQVRIVVKDTGIGIPKDKRKNVFSRFSPGESSESSMGIGLNLTKSLVDANKGEIFYTPNPAGGTIMTVILPTETYVYESGDFKTVSGEVLDNEKDLEIQREVVIHEIDDKEKPVRPINRHKILVVDDEYEIRKLIVEVLRDYFNVVEASNGQDALKLVHSDSSIELVICDVMMPVMSGYEVVSLIKNDIDTCHIPVILLTALESDEKKHEGFKSGADAYITKPFRPDYILTRILKLLEQRNKLREKFSNDLSLKTDAICTNDLDREFMDKVDKILNQQLSNPNFSMDDFASEMAMGRSSFYSKIHKVTGYSPNKYLRILRMKKAAELILTGNYTAAEVSYMVGIQDASYFSKSFREQFGISPKAYYKKVSEGLIASERDQDQGSNSDD